MSGMELDNVADRKMGLTEILEEDKDGRTVNRDYSDNQDMHRLGKKQEFKVSALYRTHRLKQY